MMGPSQAPRKHSQNALPDKPDFGGSWWLLKALFISDWLAVFGSSKAAYKENSADRWDMAPKQSALHLLPLDAG